MARLCDGWAVHVRMSKFAVSPVARGVQGEFLGIYDANRVGISRKFHKRNGMLKDNVRIFTQMRGNTRMYNPAMR